MPAICKLPRAGLAAGAGPAVPALLDGNGVDLMILPFKNQARASIRLAGARG